jgi:hypothetical protein
MGALRIGEILRRWPDQPQHAPRNLHRSVIQPATGERLRGIRRRVPRDRARARVWLALVVGFAAFALAITVTASNSPPVVAGTNAVAPEGFVATTRGDATFCQDGETLPRDTSAIRLWVNTNISPSVEALVSSESQLLTRGTQQAGPLTAAIAVPVTPVARTVTDARLCFRLGPAVEPVKLVGGTAPVRRRGEAPVLKIRVEYLRAGRRSWWSLLPTLARRIGYGRAPSGAWVVFIPLLLMACAAFIAAGLLLRQLTPAKAVGSPSPQQSRPRSGQVLSPAVLCAGIAFLSAASWSILTPPFQASDEPSHFAYVQQLAETASLPQSSGSSVSEEEEVALTDLHHSEVRFNPAIGTIATAAEQSRLESELAKPLARSGAGDAGVAASEPPLYYGLETIPYLLGSSGSLLDRLELMRLLSAVMAGITVLFAFLFLREALPRVPWAWTVGALAIALAPLLGFISGTVNPDAMLSAVCAALFYALARAFRRGLTPRRAVAIGALSAIGLVTKLNFIGLLPGIALALVILTARARRVHGRDAYRTLALALIVPATPAALYIAISLLSNHAGLGILSSGLGETTEHHGSLTAELAYIWQFFLPRLPGMPTDFPGVFPLRQIWFDRSIGAYGWLDTYFPNWVYDVALVPFAVLAVLCGRALIVSRAGLRVRAGELLSYGVIGVGVMALVGADSYLEFPGSAGHYAEPRYLLPMAVLFAAVLALAARGAGRRWGPVAGTLIVVLMLAYDVFSQLLLVGRFYA